MLKLHGFLFAHSVVNARTKQSINTLQALLKCRRRNRKGRGRRRKKTTKNETTKEKKKK